MIQDRPSSCRICVGDAVHYAEAAIQASEERVPVLVVAREVDAPLALEAFCPSESPFSSAQPFSFGPTGLQNSTGAGPPWKR